MTRTARFLSVFLLASLGCACEKSQSSHASTVTANPVQAPALAPPVATTPAATDADTSTNAPTTATTPEVPMPTPTIAASPDLAFAFDLLGVMPGSAAGTNLVYSPTSIAAVLAMAELGAGGETAQQIADGLHRPVEHAAMLVSLQSLVSSWKGADKSNPLQVANAIYLHNELTLAPTYRKQITGDFAANVETVDFVGASEKARKQINTWVAKQTHQLIKELLMPGAVGADTVMVLVNAVYFKGKWAKPFNVKTSHNDVFHAAGQDVQVTMMSSHIPLRRAISTSGNYRLLEIPYATKGLSMLLLLPNESTTLAEVEKSLAGGASFENAVADLASTEIALELPKFRLEPPSSLRLRPALEALGMRTMFVTNQADFSGMLAENTKALAASEVLHKAFIEIDEAGTTAAAATSMGMYAASVPAYEDFIFNRPFLAFVYDDQNKVIHFAARVANPTLK